MAYPDYDRRHHEHTRRHHDYPYAPRDSDRDTYSGRDTSYSRHAHYPSTTTTRLTTMRSNVNNSSYSYSDPHQRYPYRTDTRNTYNKPRWPPKPSVEDEVVSLAKEVKSSAEVEPETAGEAQARGSVDQNPIIEDNDNYIHEQSNYNNYSDSDNDERRFVLLSDPAAAPRRKSFAERGNMRHIKTNVNADNDPPVCTERTSTPYAYTKPQKEYTAPDSKYVLSPEPITPQVSASIPRSVPRGQTWDQNARPQKSSPVHSRYDSFQAQSPRSNKNDALDDSDADSDTTRLRTDRKPARYSFVKSDLQKEDLRTSLLDGQVKNEKGRSGEPLPDERTRGTHYSSSGSSKGPTPSTQSPRSSTGSLNNESGGYSRQKSRPVPVDTSYSSSPKYHESRPVSPRPSSPRYRERPAEDRYKSSSKYPDSRTASPRPSTPTYHEAPQLKPRPVPVETSYKSSSSNLDSRPQSPRPHSPVYREPPQAAPRSPKMPPLRRPADSPPTSRPLSRSGPNSRPASPLSFSTTVPPPPPHGRMSSVTGADWHATYPPISATDRSRPQERYQPRHGDSLPVPKPRIDVQSPSPVRHPNPAPNPLPYPVDDRQSDVFMPPEAAYQFDHAHAPAAPSPRVSAIRQPYNDSPKLPSSPVPNSPRDRPSAFMPSVASRHTGAPEETPRVARVRSDSIRSQSSHDSGRQRRIVLPSLDRPFPSCPRSEPSDRDNDWYTLEGCPGFDMCPSCYDGVFADTPFSVCFKQTRRFERPVERSCDFSSPWMRLAWLLTIKQRRQSLDLIYALADVADRERPCPKDREAVGTWYGILDPRDGIHVSKFAICPNDMKNIEVLFPSIKGYFTKLTNHGALARQHVCSLRITSRRFPKYLDLLVELDAEAQNSGQAPDIRQFIQLARENAYKQECQRDKKLIHKAWYYIPGLTDFTVCEECYDNNIAPAIAENNPIATLFNRTIQLVQGEDSEGSSCCLYSPRMQRVWARSVEEQDLSYLRRKAHDRKRAEVRLGRERNNLLGWMVSTERGTREYESAKRELSECEREWRGWE
jgi:hypothetical protein